MARTRIILGYPNASKASTPFLVYCGPSGGDAETAQRGNLIAHRFEIFEGPGRFKNNSRFNPSAVPPVAAPAAESLRPLIPVELGEGEGKVTLHVETQEEADFLKMLSKSMIDAGEMITALQTAGSELRTAAAACAGDVTKLETLLTSANGQITQLEADLQRETAYKAEVNQRIATLEADLKAAQAEAETKTKKAK